MDPMSFRMSCLLVEMPANAVVPAASRRDETKTRMSSISLMGSVVLVYEKPIYNNIFIVFQGCSECLCKLDFFRGIVSLLE